jgi:hypothetical protein
MGAFERSQAGILPRTVGVSVAGSMLSLLTSSAGLR